MPSKKEDKHQPPAQCASTAPTAVLPPPLNPRPRPSVALTKVQCSRCLNTMELQPERVRTSVRCTKCQRNLRIPKSIKQACPYCGAHCDFRTDVSGRRTKCPQCGMGLLIHVQMVRPRRRRRRRMASLRPRQSGSLIPLIVSLGVSILGLMLCFRLLANL